MNKVEVVKDNVKFILETSVYVVKQQVGTPQQIEWSYLSLVDNVFQPWA